MEINPGDKHINSYYTVFNKPCPKNLDDLVKLIDEELETLGQFDINLQLNIMNNYFAGSTLAELAEEYEFSYERLTEIYGELVNILNFWRDKDILETEAKL